MKLAIASSTTAGWSRCGECRQSARRSSSIGPPVCLAIASSCAIVPYSSSKPWIASTGQCIRGRTSSMFQLLKSGCIQMSFPPERLRRVGMIAAELLRKVGVFEGGLRLRDALHADVFDEDMGRHEHQPLDGVVLCRVDERDRSAVGMAHENRFADAEVLEQLGQDLERLDMHVVDCARPAQHFGLAVAV